MSGWKKKWNRTGSVKKRETRGKSVVSTLPKHSKGRKRKSWRGHRKKFKEKRGRKKCKYSGLVKRSRSGLWPRFFRKITNGGSVKRTILKEKKKKKKKKGEKKRRDAKITTPNSTLEKKNVTKKM